MAAKQKGYSAALSLRIPEELKEQCISRAREDGLTTNEWIKRTLEKAVTSGFAEDLVTDEELTAWYEQEFIIPEKTDELEKPSREEFVRIAVQQLLGMYRCKNCGEINRGTAKHCSDCGEEIAWEHPDHEIAMAIMMDYAKTHPKNKTGKDKTGKDKTGFSYILSTPASFVRTGRFQILEPGEDKQGGCRIVKEITPDEIALRRRILESRERREQE